MKNEYNEEIIKCDSELSSIKDWIVKNKFDVKTKYLISYAVIRASGLIEKIYKEIIYDWLECEKSDDNKKFLEYYTVDSSSNPNTGNIESMIQKFNSTKKEDFIKRVKMVDNLKSDLNQLVEFRNSVSHGNNISASIDVIYRMYLNGKKVLNIIDEILR